MKKTTLGRTGLTVSRTGFGALPIQRISFEEAGSILRRAQRAGITLFDTARSYSDSEEKIGRALSDVRDGIILATKTPAKDAAGFWRDLEASLKMLRCEHIDIYQFHNPSFVPAPGGEDGLYDAALQAKERGLIRFIGITQHALTGATEAVRSGLYDVLQYPFNHLATDEEIALIEECGERGVGVLAMKALSGGLITDASVPFSFLRRYGHVVPIWGIQRMEELEQFIELDREPPALDAEMLNRIQADREALSGAFCRGCGYCLPCPADIPIHMANRMSQLITRSPEAPFKTEAWRQNMEKITDCTGCGACEARCPYHLKPYETLPEHLEFYRKYTAE